MRKRNLSVISPAAAMFTDQSERSYSRGSNQLLKSGHYGGGGFEASQILKRKIGGLARRNIAMETTRNMIE